MPTSEIAAKVKNYLALVKFSHSIFAMPFALFGFALGVTDKGDPLIIRLLLLVILCMLFARNAAMSFNRWADQDIDRSNPRTSQREIPAKVIESRSALIFCIVNAVLFILTTWFINKLCFFLSPLALLVVMGYSFTKRFTALSHFVLGLGLALAPTGAYIAVTGRFALVPVIISFAVLCWVSGFDIIYALQDDEFDRAHRLRSVPVAIGRKGALLLSLVLHCGTMILLIWAGFAAKLGFIFWLGLVIFGLLLFYQHVIVKPGDLRRVNTAFFTLNGIASLLFAAFAIADIIV